MLSKNIVILYVQLLLQINMLVLIDYHVLDVCSTHDSVINYSENHRFTSCQSVLSRTCVYMVENYFSVVFLIAPTENFDSCRVTCCM